VRLRDPRPSDSVLLHAWRKEEALRAHQPFAPLTAEQIRTDLEKHLVNDLPNYGKDRYQWIVERIEDRTAMGWVTVSVRSWEHQIAEIGYSLATAFHGQGFGSEAVELVLYKLFYEAGMYRVEAKCSVENEASYRLLEKVGFRRDGILRAYFNIQSRRVDHYLYSLLRTEYFASH
jgi:RimJ/RimL family protein N-acetyltransferase